MVGAGVIAHTHGRLRPEALAPTVVIRGNGYPRADGLPDAETLELRPAATPGAYG